MSEKMPSFPSFPEKKENLHEEIFSQLVCEKIIEDLEEDLFDIFHNEEVVENLIDMISKLSPEEQRMVLALPKFLRKRRLSFLKNKYSKIEGCDLEKMIIELKSDSKKNGYTLGYHISKNKILEKDTDWTVDGRDLDDRDERKMAYYSLDYENLFRKKRGNFLYIVRAIIGENSPHKKDNSNNWGRADKLSVISELPLKEIDDMVSEITENRKNKENI